ncbi:hypothetical protein [Rubellicoccus peritrichatus]|uniref:Uncharacterized protein n=1 Tax=Rubellicoccus peritrichatus TaxID=3080537 RepID=A0AAQ3LCP9_9BACT|nr:hypothetical protein [Puniceicoccus sp. CR14]WOO39529.1 hypothetical protein RZN69_12970 [Puniceicoccus sp. CR14]
MKKIITSLARTLFYNLGIRRNQAVGEVSSKAWPSVGTEIN